mgnify:CR=1 FL=1
MFGFLRQVGDYTRDAVDAARNLAQGFSVTFDHMKRRPVTVQYPYEKLIPSERYRGRIHYEFDKCIACEVCVRVCPINLPVVDWVMNKATKKKELRNYSIDFGVCIFCGNCVEYCPTNCLSMTEEYELAAFDRHSLNYDNVALGRLPTSVTTNPTRCRQSLISPPERNGQTAQTIFYFPFDLDQPLSSVSRYDVCPSSALPHQTPI